MSNDQTDTNRTQIMPIAVTDEQRYRLASDIIARQRTRSEYIGRITFGEPSWDILLDLFVAEALHHPTSIKDIALRLGLKETLCDRYVRYMLNQEVLFENTNRHMATEMPFLISPDSRDGIKRWLDECLLSERGRNS